MSKLKILDCTLRDGGYYTNWDFDSDLVKKYFKAVASVDIDYVEIGLRSLENKSFKGAFAYCKEEYLKILKIPKKLAGKIGVMVNASEFCKDDISVAEAVEDLFPDNQESIITLVRIAAHHYELEKAFKAIKILKAKGFKVGLNLMQISERSDEEIISVSKDISQSNLDVFYFADSMGCLFPQDINRIVKLIRQSYKGEIGIHTHDNMSNALANSITAADCGVTWIDGTITGMGRGPGNVQTENLLLSLRKDSISKFSELFNLVQNIFKPLQNLHGWGANPYYYLAGKYSIHPTYIQNMLSDKRFTSDDIISVINNLKEEGGKSFSMERLFQKELNTSLSGLKKWKPHKVFSGQEVLILATGQSVKKYKDPIELYIKNKNPIVIALNEQKNINEHLIDYRIACHPLKILSDYKEYSKFGQKMIMPENILDDGLRKELKSLEIFNYELLCKSDTFEFNDTSCTIPHPMVMLYVLGLVNSGKAKSVLIAGFDGYSTGDPRNGETIKLFELYFSNSLTTELTSITPTKYNLPTKSIYGML
jgi:4-hydroxy 2-oxovalerate aldolase